MMPIQNESQNTPENGNTNTTETESPIDDEHFSNSQIFHFISVQKVGTSKVVCSINLTFNYPF